MHLCLKKKKRHYPRSNDKPERAVGVAVGLGPACFRGDMGLCLFLCGDCRIHVAVLAGSVLSVLGDGAQPHLLTLA